jgi:hypothetical protein
MFGKQDASIATKVRDYNWKQKKIRGLRLLFLPLKQAKNFQDSSSVNRMSPT